MDYIRSAATGCVLLLCAPGWAQVKPAKSVATTSKPAYFVDLNVLDMSLFVAAPPAGNSATTLAELAEIHRVERSRTAEQIAAAQADDKEEDIFSYRNVLGERFNAEALPITTAFSAHVHNDQGAVGGPLKNSFRRPRPYQADSTLHPVCELNSEPTSYPSGHTLSGYLLAYALVEMVPEKREQILARADDYAHNRIVCGVHYPSDLEASRRLAAMVFGYMMSTPRFQKELAAARLETRQHLGLSMQ
jgi:acid phosphatase (class A)